MDFQKLLEQAEAMQASLSAVEDQLKDTVYEGTSGGSHGVSIRMNGENEIQEIQIADELMSLENKEMLQDMLMIAFNHANEQIQKDRTSKMQNVTGNMKLPGM